jgi:hypothetical protein
MQRTFVIEWVDNHGFWHLAKYADSEAEVEEHCRKHKPLWEEGKFRLFEKRPIKVFFETIVSLKEAN